MQGKEQGEVDGRSDGAFGKMRAHADMKHKEALNSGENRVTQGRSCTLGPLFGSAMTGYDDGNTSSLACWWRVEGTQSFCHNRSICNI